MISGENLELLRTVWTRTRQRELKRMREWKSGWNTMTPVENRRVRMSQWSSQPFEPRVLSWPQLCVELPEAERVLRACIIDDDLAMAMRRRHPEAEDLHSLLAEEKRVALVMMVAGYNVFVTGSAGVGKSKVVGSAVATLTKMFSGAGRDIIVTGTTGVAAFNIGGATLASQMSLMTPERRRWIGPMKTRIESLATLLVDEVSMLSVRDWYRTHLRMVAAAEEVTDELATKFPGMPFAGRQIIVVGDFFQLADVPRSFSGVDRQRREDNARLSDLAEFQQVGPESEHFDRWQRVFKTPLWWQAVANVPYMRIVERQSDRQFAAFLNAVRWGAPNQADVVSFTRRHLYTVDKVPLQAMYLFAKNDDADAHNTSMMIRLDGPDLFFCVAQRSRLAGDKRTREEHDGELPKHRREVTVRRGARIRLVSNFSVPLGIINGTQAELVDLVPITDIAVQRRQQSGGVVIEPRKLAYDPDEMVQRYCPAQRPYSGIDGVTLLPGGGFQLEWSGNHGGVRLVMASGDSVYHEENLHPLECERTESSVHKYHRADGASRGSNHNYDEHPDSLTRFFCPVVRVASREELFVLAPVLRTRYEQRRGHNVPVNSQLMTPIVPGYAGTVHSAQGLTLDSVAIHLNAMMDPALPYVALSRATTADGVYLTAPLPFERMAPTPDITRLYKQLEKQATSQ